MNLNHLSLKYLRCQLRCRFSKDSFCLGQLSLLNKDPDVVDMISPGKLHRSGLVLSDSVGQGVQLKKRRDERKRKEMIGAMSNVLSFRFRGFDPERILNGIYPWVSWFFTTTATNTSHGHAL